MSTISGTTDLHITRDGLGWPTSLSDDASAGIETLWLRGPHSEALADGRPRVAVVGSRACTAYGKVVAARLGSGLIDAGVHVIAAADYGIADAALAGALTLTDAQSQACAIGVLAGGLDVPHPVGRTGLIEHAQRAGLALSAWEGRPNRTTCMARVRLIAALCDALVVVEAGPGSAVRAIVERADALGRPVLAVPGPITSTTSIGCHDLIRTGLAQLVTDRDDVLEAL